MEKICPVKFDVECDQVIHCPIPRILARCQHLHIDVESMQVFMSNPLVGCSVLCKRTNHVFTGDEFEDLIHCTQKEFEEGTCPRAGEPDVE